MPISNSATVHNIGFHDVDYHSGVPYDGTDWPATVAGGWITWSTEEEATNPQANALRWGTSFNFRFEADAAPAAGGKVTIGLFKAGSPGTVTAMTVVPVRCTKGDINDDGGVDGEDINRFLDVLINGGGTNAEKCAGDVEFVGPIGHVGDRRHGDGRRRADCPGDGGRLVIVPEGLAAPRPVPPWTQIDNHVVAITNHGSIDPEIVYAIVAISGNHRAGYIGCSVLARRPHARLMRVEDACGLKASQAS